MKISCVIIDDEPCALHLLDGYISKTKSLELKASFFNGMDALDYLRNTKIDVIFTDIDMPLLTGLELAGILNRNQKFIFTTAYSQYALNSFNYCVLDYLLKPILFNRFLQALQKIENSTAIASDADSSNTNFIFVKSNGKILRIDLVDIYFIKAEREYVSIHRKNDRKLIYKRMKEMEKLLPANFVRVHNSYIINSQYIESAEGNRIIINSQAIPVSDSFRNNFVHLVKSKTI